MGEIGISPSEFELMTYAEMILAIRGYEKMQEREWERTRKIAYQIYMSYPTKGSKGTEQAYLPLPSDRNKIKRVDPDTREFFRQKAIKMNEKNLN